MKKSIALFLTIIVLLQSGVLLLFYQGGISYVRLEMQQRLQAQKEGLETLTLSVDEYQKHLVEKNELDIHGNRYDIQSIKQVNGKIIAKVLRDRHEEKIIAWIKDMTGKQSSSSDQLSHQISQLLSLTYFAQDTQGLVFASIETRLRKIDFSSVLTEQVTTLATPPPEVA